MQISLSTGTIFFLPLPRIFEIAVEAGFDGVELIINQVFQKKDPVRLINSLLPIAPIHSIHSPFMQLEGWGSPIDSLKQSVKVAAECGVPLVNFHPPSWMGFEIGFWRWLYSINDFQKEVGLNGQVIVAMENMPWVGKLKINPNILSNTTRMIDFLKDRNLAMTFDCTHMGSGKTNFINDFYLCYESGCIRNIHFSDYGYGREHLLPGHGILPLPRFLNHLRNTDYRDTVTLELDPAELPKGEQVIIESLREILEYLRTETGKQVNHVRDYDQSFEPIQMNG